ncbi:hypothetical protein AB6N09_05655 [Wolbachia endosymbiont of Tettigetta isshikii]
MQKKTALGQNRFLWISHVCHSNRLAMQPNRISNCIISPLHIPKEVSILAEEFGG